ncbi:hypothetical protein AWN76_013985 [Rhodothermaceae bacterium RA]|nr:hypothetical protein AWN76_013985 [Rhodothermaceae bacterium RA]
MTTRLLSRLFGLLFVAGLLAPPATGQDVRELIGVLRREGATALEADPDPATRRQQFTTYLNVLAAEEQGQERMRGTIAFGLNGDETGDEQLYKINAGISLARGQYPSQVEFASRVGVTLDGDAFQENVSDLRLSYDYHPSLSWETFVFLERRTDNFMSIDQRYEVGGGVVLNRFLGLTEDGRARREALALRDAVQPVFRALLSPAEQQAMDRAHARALPAIRKRHSRTRLALLVGVLAEFEQATLTWTAPDGTTVDERAQGRRSKLRWEVRPTLDVQPVDGLEWKLRPYLKLPSPWVWTETIGRGTTATQRADYRLDLYTDLTISLGGSEVFGGGVSLTLSYQMLYDHAPPYARVEPPGGEPILLQAEDLHHVVRLSFGLQFR